MGNLVSIIVTIFMGDVACATQFRCDVRFLLLSRGNSRNTHFQCHFNVCAGNKTRNKMNIKYHL